jgi:hypothetical protein
MPQETNLNVAPYFDDFDPQQNYYKILFKPGFPVQARELTGLQSILQNQIEDVGNHFFKEGAKVIPGDLTYVKNYFGIQIESEYLGVPVGIYLDQLVGTIITGRTSGVTAKVVEYITDEQSERGVYTLYLNYENSSTDEDISTFLSGEVLVTSTNINYATTFIAEGEGFATTIPQNAPIVGSSFNLSQGIYFLRGYFVDVQESTLILDQYSNTPTYRVGLDVAEEIVSIDTDPSLGDNAQGFNNYTAPGADRLKITATLAKVDSDNFDQSNFVQLSEVRDGELISLTENTDYNFLGDELARRTFDESGHYYVKEFVTTVKDSLNDNEGNRGIYQSNQTTAQGSQPSEDLGIYKISPGKAYVKGYEVETISPLLLDFKKPRSTKTLKNQAVNFGFGPTLSVNRVYGSPTIGFNTTGTLSLRSHRIGANQETSPGKEIGIARIYDFALESGSYDSTFPDINVWDLSLFDVQTYTDITVNEPLTINTSAYIKGESSGATGFLKYNVSAGTALTAYGVEGNFVTGERLLFNGVLDNSRFVSDSTNYSLADTKSVFGIVGSASTFSADIIQTPSRNLGSGFISGNDGGSSRVTIGADPGFSFIGIVTTGNLVRYSRPSLDIVSYGRVSGVGRTNFTISAVQTVNGVCNGALPTGNENITNVQIINTKASGTQGSGNLTDNEALYSAFPKKNVSSINLTDSVLTVRRQFTTNISGNSTPLINADANEVFLPFDEERYTLIRSNGQTEVLTEDRFSFTNGSQTLQINGLGANDTGSKLITTLRKRKVTSKSKIKSVSNSILIDKSNNTASGIGSTTLNDGLTSGSYPYGTRVQDDIISLNTPDVLKIYGVFQSSDTTDPTCPSMTLGQLDGVSATTNDLIIGETLTGQTSGAKAIYLEKLSDTSVYFIYLNSSTFENGEVVTAETSSVNGVASSVDLGSKNITQDFRFNNGQKGGYYDYSRLVRRGNASVPARKLKVYFATANYDVADEGDITTVNSYNSFDFKTEIPTVNGRRNTDIIDARPRVVDYTVSENSRSPLEFDGRNFFDDSDGNTQSSMYTIASDESMTLDYSYYVPRADRIYIDKNGSFSIVYGTPDDQPRLPDSVSGSMNIANVFLPAYLYNTSDVKVNFVEHKRYQMSDIAKIEQRVKNLEYYTSLNQIEQSTLNLFVEDANGNNRFKSGVFTDNFTTLEPQDTSIGIRNSVDTKKGILRPSHYTTSLNLQLGTNVITGIGSTSDSNQDPNFAEVIGSNVKKSGRVITLDYSSKVWLEQPYATRLENVTPFLVQFWQGNIELTPEVDVWIDVNRLEVNNVMMEGSFQGISEALGAEVRTNADGSRTGVSPVIWNSWETVGVNMDLSLSNEQEFLQGASDVISNGLVDNLLRGRDVGVNQIVDASDAIVNNIQASGGTSLDQQRTGTQFTVNEQIDTESLGDRVVRRDIINFMRSRNIEFTGTRFKPYTRVYSFFDDVDVNKFAVPKLIEIEMQNGVFEVGELVRGRMANSSARRNAAARPSINFRVANTNHKYGPYNNPSDVYDSNPYSRDNTIPRIYSASSTLLNVDLFSLQSEDFPQFSGNIAAGMILVGASSQARAKVKSVRLVTDRLGTIQGSYRVPDGSNSANPTFETGRSKFRLTSSRNDSKIEGSVTTAAETTFYSQGDVDTTQESTLSVRNARVVRSDVSQSRQIGDVTTSNTISVESGFDVNTTIEQDITNITQEFITNVTEVTEVTNVTNVNVTEVTEVTNVTNVTEVTNVTNNIQRIDPLAQTFFINDNTGIYITQVEVFFQSKDQNVPVVCQLRETNLGTPTEKVLPFSEITVDPKNIKLSENGTAGTIIKFEAPVYLNSGKEYAIVLLSHSTEYKVWISRLGEADVKTSSREAGQVIVTEQPLLGSLFKSQNASVWTPSQYEDLKFRLYSAEFKTTGTVQFFNPDLPESLAQIDPNGITVKSREIRIGIGTTLQDAALTLGNTVKQLNIGSQGTLVALGGSATGDMSLTNAGVGFTPSAAQMSFTGVALTAVTGRGINATADITIQNGVAIAATINNGGLGYVVGDVLSPISVGTDNLGSGMQLSVSEILGSNVLVLDDVQGNFSTNSSFPLYYENNSGITTELNYSVGGDVVPLSPITTVNAGHYLKIFQRNHGMYSNVNRVTIKDVESDVKPNSLAQEYSFDSTTFITLNNVSAPFATFENLGVGATNPGYVKIGDEIISYTGTNGRTLTGVVRGVDNTTIASHSEDELVYKYELDGVSLRRINKDHQLADVVSSELDEAPIGLDYYYLKVLMNTQGTNRAPANAEGFPALYFKENTVAGGPDVTGSYNLPFSLITPKITTAQPLGTNLLTQIRTISATSISGNQPSYSDAGFKLVNLFDKNYFESQRMIAAKVNETNLLNNEVFPGNKSFNMLMTLISTDKRISPVIDLDNASVVFTSNRVNQPVTNYATDQRVNGTEDDPNRFFYVSKNINLENPATSLQVILDGYASNNNDIRVFYALNQDKKPEETIFIPFPGYSNIGSNGSILDIAANDGNPDIRVPRLDSYQPEPSVNLYKEFKFTVDDLVPFKSFRIKIIGTSTDQSNPPLIRNLRAISFA